MTRSLIQGRDSLIFPNICNLPPSSFQLFITMIFSAMLLIHFSLFWNEDDFSRPEPTPPLFMFLWILCLTKYDKIMF